MIPASLACNAILSNMLSERTQTCRILSLLKSPFPTKVSQGDNVQLTTLEVFFNAEMSVNGIQMLITKSQLP